MGIVLARIDNRLLHGIVATQWAGRSGAQRIMIIDDTVANSCKYNTHIYLLFVLTDGRAFCLPGKLIF